MRNEASPRGRRLSTANCILALIAVTMLIVTVGLYILNSGDDSSGSLLQGETGSITRALLQGRRPSRQYPKSDANNKNAEPAGGISSGVLQQRLSGLLKSNDFQLLKQQLRAIRTGDVGRAYSIKTGEKPVTGGAGHSGPIGQSLLVDEADQLLAESSVVGAPWTRLKYHRSVDRSKTIFVAIPNANSNSKCTALVDSIFSNAQFPFQIRVGLVEAIEDVKSVVKRQPTTDPGMSPATLEMHIKSEPDALDDEFKRHLDARGGDSEESKKQYSDANLPSKIHPEDRDLLFHRSSCVHPKHALCNQSKFCPTDYIRVRKVPRSEMLEKGRGVSWMRHLSTMMYRSEQYILFLDAASGPLGANWDAALIDQYQKAATNSASSPSSQKRGLVVLSGRVPKSNAAEPFSALSLRPSTNAASPIESCAPNLDATAEGISSSSLPVVTTTSGPAGGIPKLTTLEFAFTEGAPFLTRVPLDPFLLDAPAALYDLVLSARMAAAGYKVVLPTGAIFSGLGDPSVAYELDKPLLLFKEEESMDIAVSASKSQRTTSTAFLDSIARAAAVLLHPVEKGIFDAAGGGEVRQMAPSAERVLSEVSAPEVTKMLMGLSQQLKSKCAKEVPVTDVKDVRYVVAGYQVLRQRILEEHVRLEREDLKQTA